MHCVTQWTIALMCVQLWRDKRSTWANECGELIFEGVRTVPTPIRITRVGRIIIILGGDKRDSKTWNNFHKILKTSNNNYNRTLHLNHIPHNLLHQWYPCHILHKLLHHNWHHTNLCIRGMRIMSYALKLQTENKHMRDLSNQIHV